MSRYLLSSQKAQTFSIVKNNGPVLLFKTIFRHRHCFPPSVASDGKDGHGLKLESFNAMPAKSTKKYHG